VSSTPPLPKLLIHGRGHRLHLRRQSLRVACVLERRQLCLVALDQVRQRAAGVDPLRLRSVSGAGTAAQGRSGRANAGRTPSEGPPSGLRPEAPFSLLARVRIASALSRQAAVLISGLADQQHVGLQVAPEQLLASVSARERDSVLVARQAPPRASPDRFGIGREHIRIQKNQSNAVGVISRLMHRDRAAPVEAPRPSGTPRRRASSKADQHVDTGVARADLTVDRLWRPAR